MSGSTASRAAQGNGSHRAVVSNAYEPQDRVISAVLGQNIPRFHGGLTLAYGLALEFIALDSPDHFSPMSPQDGDGGGRICVVIAIVPGLVFP